MSFAIIHNRAARIMTRITILLLLLAFFTLAHSQSRYVVRGLYASKDVTGTESFTYAAIADKCNDGTMYMCNATGVRLITCTDRMCREDCRSIEVQTACEALRDGSSTKNTACVPLPVVPKSASELAFADTDCSGDPLEGAWEPIGACTAGNSYSTALTCNSTSISRKFCQTRDCSTGCTVEARSTGCQRRGEASFMNACSA